MISWQYYIILKRVERSEPRWVSRTQSQLRGPGQGKLVHPLCVSPDLSPDLASVQEMAFDTCVANIAVGIVQAKNISCIGLANHTLGIGNTETGPHLSIALPNSLVLLPIGEQKRRRTVRSCLGRGSWGKGGKGGGEEGERLGQSTSHSFLCLDRSWTGCGH